MSDTPLAIVGRLQAGEIAAEVVAPLTVAAAAWLYAREVLSDAVPGTPLTPLEVMAALGACIALTSWAVGRQFYLYGKRSPWTGVLWAIGINVAVLLGLPVIVRSDFETACAGLGGAVSAAASLDGEEIARRLCQVGAVPDNAYLPGVILRPAWEGVVSPWQWAGFVVLAGVTTLGLRTTRLWPTQVPRRVIETLRFAPAAGSASVLGEPAAKDGRVQACANATLWGDVCGQLYAAEKEFAPGEWCLRCHQVYRPVDRELVFSVVTLFSGDVDVLNGLERVDTVSWRQEDPMPADARLSGQERWVRLGEIKVPDVITVAQLLALVHERISAWSGTGDEAVRKAAALAEGRASRISGWIWKGPVASRLTYARPTPSAILAIGPVRLRDLDLDTGEELTLQLDIGLLPLELRVGFRKTFLDASRDDEVQNSRQNLWIPVGPPAPLEEAPGLWVPRIEGDALRAWLSTERFRAEGQRGVTSPLPYHTGGRVEGTPGPLDLVRLPVERDEVPARRRIGASIAEWKWLEAEQIELLRREALVLVEAGR